MKQASHIFISYERLESRKDTFLLLGRVDLFFNWSNDTIKWKGKEMMKVSNEVLMYHETTKNHITRGEECLAERWRWKQYIYIKKKQNQSGTV